MNHLLLINGNLFFGASMNTIILLAIATSLVALIYSFIKRHQIFKIHVENEKLIQIGSYINDGANTFLKREYIVLLPFVFIVAFFLLAGNRGSLKWQSLAFLMGSLFSALAGYLGMTIATNANTKTAQKATEGMSAALKVAFAGGSVMGMTVVGLAILGISILILFSRKIFGNDVSIAANTIYPIVTGFSLGASTVALFARVGGGIFTKAADVGADLVGKVEAGIPEDDPRNPAVIADNVGDNVGDVAGMGADLFESYVGSIIGCMILGASTPADDQTKLLLSILPLLLCSIGILSSVIGTFFVRITKNGSPQKALNRGSFSAAILTILIIFPVCIRVFSNHYFYSMKTGVHIALSAVFGIVAGVLLGVLTEFFTGKNTKQVRKIEKACITGPATTIISGLSVGMLSTFPPILIIGFAIIASYLASGFYGIGIAGLGMLLTLGIQLSVDAYGPIADNAGGLAVMSEMDPNIREITDELDAVGNTTAAIGKGFAIGSAALTSIILFSSFSQSIFGSISKGFDITDPFVLAGLLIGGMIPFLFSSLAMDAIGIAAYAMIEEVRRQFREKPGILEEKEIPDYKKCIDISTNAALVKMILPGSIAVISPIAIGFFGGIYMLGGFLAGATITGVLLAIFMANSGGAWDNAKKLVESKEHGKGSESHKAAVVGDTVGDPFKDTAGPSLNILIKLMSIISVVIAPMLKSFWKI